MEVRVLGPVEVAGQPVVGRDAAVLATLAVSAPRAVATHELIDAVWGEDAPVTAGKALQNAISRLRRLLGAERIVTVERAYRLDAPVDLQEVERLAAAGKPDEALAYWRGEPLSLSEHERVRIAELRAGLEDEAARSVLARGEVDLAASMLERLVAEAPYREPRWAMLVRALTASGRQGDALRAAQRARRVLGDDLGLEPGAELQAAEQEVFERPARAQTRRSVPRFTTSFLGRDNDVGAVRRAADDHHLVTLVGPGGVGKTRLVVAALADRNPFFVDLAAVRADHVWEAIATSAGIATSPGRDVAEAVTAALGDGVLVLDSCEHVLDEAAEVAARLDIDVVATSREPLGLPEERVIAVSPLARDAAVELFVDRAGGSEPEPALRELCARLDDLPLAIELAAAQASVLTAEQIVKRLDDRFALLDERARRGEPRQRGLGAMVEWSYDLLEADERLLFERLSVFRGTFSLEDAEAVVADDALPLAVVAPALARLVRASMVATDERRRFRLLDTFRAFAERRLGEAEPWRRRHLEWVAGLAAAAGPELSGPNQLAWFTQVGVALDDVQEALAWCGEHGPAEVGLSIATNLFHFWMGRARRAEGLRWLELFAATADNVPAVERCRALLGAGSIAMLTDMRVCEGLGALAQRIADDRDSAALADTLVALAPLYAGDYDTAATLIRRARPVLEEPQHDATFPQFWDARAFLSMVDGDVLAARAAWQTGLSRLEAIGDEHLYGGFLAFDADFAFAQGHHEEAEALALRALEIARNVGCPSCESSALAAMSVTHRSLDTDDRLAAIRLAVRLAAGINEVFSVEWATRDFAAMIAPDDPERSARLIGALEALQDETGHRVYLPGRTQYAAPRLSAAQRAMKGRWDELVADGRALTYDDLVGLVLQVP